MDRLTKLKNNKLWRDANKEFFYTVDKEDYEWLIDHVEKLEQIRNVFYVEDTIVLDGYRMIIEIFEGKETIHRSKRQ